MEELRGGCNIIRGYLEEEDLYYGELSNIVVIVFSRSTPLPYAGGRVVSGLKHRTPSKSGEAHVLPYTPPHLHPL